MTVTLTSEVTLASLTGVWKRRSIAWPDGRKDTSTSVYWLQGARHYADLRIPANRPSFDGTDSLASCSTEQKQWLARQEGFAGVLRPVEGAWQWVRELDYQPSSGKRDIGELTYSDDACSVMLEEGVDEPYTEVWERLDPAESTKGQALVLRLQSQAAGYEPRARGGCLIVVGEHFLLAIDHRDPLPPASSLSRLANATTTDTNAVRWLDMEISHGICDGRMNQWRITDSTLPWREGQPLFPEKVFSINSQARSVIERDAISKAAERTWLIEEPEPEALKIFRSFWL
jgi:hypothetical protein